MNSKWTVFFLCLILIQPLLLGADHSNFLDKKTDVKTRYLISYETHSPINITSDDDFLSQNFTGSGTTEDPYVLENVQINGGGFRGISIVNTRVAFEIRNCSLSYMSGPYFENLSRGAIIDCDMNRCSLQIIDSLLCNVSGNSLDDNGFNAITAAAITFWNSNNCIVEDNEIHDFSSAYDDGIFNIFSDNTTIRRNHIRSKDWGIWIYSSNGCVIDECIVTGCQTGLVSRNPSRIDIVNSQFYDNPGGVVVSPKSDTRILNNSLWDTGFIFQDGWYVDRSPLDWDIDFQDNQVNGRHVLYLYQLGETQVDCSTSGQVIVAWCSGTTLRNGNFQSTTIGIQVFHSDSCTLDKVVSTHNTQAGVQVKYSNNTVIQYCDLSFQDDHADGIFAMLCNGIEIDSNTIEYNSDGINLDWEVSFATITNNDVIFNSQRGIMLSTTTRNCTVYDNSIGGNGENAVDFGEGNKWDDGISLGNRWSDYSGFGPYELHTNDAVDNYPQILPGDWGETTTPTIYYVSVIPLLAFLGVVVILLVLKRYPNHTRSLAEKLQRSPT